MTSQTTLLAYYLSPVLALVALTYLVAASILVVRLADIVLGRRPVVFYENYSGVGGPKLVQSTTNQMTNLFEFPVLFYAVICIALACNITDPLLQELAWYFVAGRWAHTLVHLTLNRLWLRTPVFMASNLVLLGMWLRIAWITFGGPL